MEYYEKNTEQEINVKIMNRLKTRREELRLSYDDLGKRTGISKSTLQRYETGSTTSIPLNKIEALAEGLRTTPQYIMGWEEEDTGVLTPTVEDLKFALFEGATGITDEMFEEVKQFAEMVKLREKHHKKLKE